jgi:hypothetical protein
MRATEHRYPSRKGASPKGKDGKIEGGGSSRDDDEKE